MRKISVSVLCSISCILSLMSMDKPSNKQIIAKKQMSFLEIPEPEEITRKPKKAANKKNHPRTMNTQRGVWKYLIQNIRHYLSDEEINPFVLTLYRANKRLHHHALLYYVPSPCDSDSDLMSDSESDTPIGICNQMQIAIRCRSALAIRLCLNDPHTAKTNHDLDEALKFAEEIHDNSLITLLIQAGATATVSNTKS